MVPTISVIVPVYKVEPYLCQCIDSILKQTFQDFELILVDDGSPDGCPAICDEYAEKDSRVRVIHKENGGLSSARNVGLENALGQYISFIDSDDYIHNEMLEMMLLNLQKNDADMAVCGVESVFPAETVYHHIKPQVLSRQEAVDLLATQWWLFVIACNKLYKRELFSQVRYPEGFINEDAATIHRLIGACNRIVTVEQTLYCYRQSANSIMRSSFSIRRTDNLSALADRIQYSYQHHWDNVFVVTANRYVCEFFDHYFLFPRNEENNKYFQRMDNSLRIALPYLLRSNTVSMQHKLYLILIRINPKLYTALRKLFS